VRTLGMVETAALGASTAVVALEPVGALIAVSARSRTVGGVVALVAARSVLAGVLLGAPLRAVDLPVARLALTGDEAGALAMRLLAAARRGGVTGVRATIGGELLLGAGGAGVELCHGGSTSLDE